jgi:hypothetical protein
VPAAASGALLDRISLMMIVTSLDEEPCRQGHHWTTHEQAQALQALRDGKPQGLTLKHQTTEITWAAGPVTFLPLANRQGALLPACAEQHPTVGHLLSGQCRRRGRSGSGMAASCTCRSHRGACGAAIPPALAPGRAIAALP